MRNSERLEDTDSGPRRYRTVGAAERRQIQSEVVREYQYLVQRVLSREVVRREHIADGIQEGTIGLLLALEKFDPSLGIPFGGFAHQYVRLEVQRWLDSAVRASPRSHEKHRYETREKQLDFFPLETIFWVADLVTNTSTPEEEFSKRELYRRVESFLLTLTDRERALLLAETRNRHSSVSSSGYLDLVERARAFVRGPDEYGALLVRRS